MKKIIIIILGLVVVGLASLLVFINPILERAKPLLLSTVSNALETPVAAKKIEVSIFPSQSFLLEEVQLGTEAENIKLSSAKITVSFLKLLRGEVALTSILLDRATLGGKLNEDGSFTINGIKAQKKSDVNVAVTDNSNQAVALKNEIKEEQGKKLVIAIEDLKIKDINLTILNKKTNGEILVKLNALTIKKDGEKARVDIDSDVANGKVGFQGELSTYNIQDPNMQVNGDLKVHFADLIPIFAFIGNAENSTPITNLDLKAKLKMPTLQTPGIFIDSLDGELAGQKFNLKGDIPNLKEGSGKLFLDLPTFSFDGLKQLIKSPALSTYTGTLQNLACEIKLEGKEKAITECKLGDSQVNGVALRIDELLAVASMIEPKTTDINKFNLKIGSGQVSINSKIVPNTATNLNVNGQGLLISDLLKFSPDESGRSKPISGTLTKLSSDLKMNGANKSGNFSVNISPFEIKGFNIFKKVSDALDVIPGLSLSMISAVPQTHAAILLSENSQFQNVSANGSIQNTKTQLSSFEAKSKGYSISGSGVLDSGSIDLKVQLVIDKELVSLLESRNSKISRVKNEDGTIVLPLEIKKSKDGTPLIIPDTKNLLKQQLGIQAKESAKKALDKVAPGLGGVVDGLFN